MEESESPQVSIYTHAAKFGAILAAISIVCVILFYVVDLSMLGNWKFLLLAIVLGIGITIYGGIKYRGEVGGYLPYGKAWVHGFVVFAVSGAISTVFNIVLYTVIDPDLPAKLTEVIIENTSAMLRNFGTPESTIDTTAEAMRAEMANQFTAVGLLWAYVKNFIWIAIIALITALFVRKNEPIELT